MFIQGNLQKVFDALFYMGVIDPVLEMDWTITIKEMDSNYDKLLEVLDVVNRDQGDYHTLMEHLKPFSEECLHYLALEVAREFADFHSREELH